MVITRQPITNEDRIAWALAKYRVDPRTGELCTLKKLQELFPGRAASVLARGVRAALKERLVEIKRASAPEEGLKRDIDLEHMLIERFPRLRGVRVIDGGREPNQHADATTFGNYSDKVTALVATALAADVSDGNLIPRKLPHESTTVGISSGRAAFNFVSALRPPLNWTNTEIFSLTGYVGVRKHGAVSPRMDANYNANRLSEVVPGSEVLTVERPCAHPDREARDKALASVEHLADWAAGGALPEYCIVGVGAPMTPGHAFYNASVQPEAYPDLINGTGLRAALSALKRSARNCAGDGFAGVVGDIGNFVFECRLSPGVDLAKVDEAKRKDLNEKINALNDLTLTASLDLYARSPDQRLIIVAATSRKAPALLEVLPDDRRPDGGRNLSIERLYLDVNAAQAVLDLARRV
jgi:DNA-binding transcriptional regulator LsrR (DeoR family)